MNLHEYQSKQLFANYGIPVPTGYVAANAEEAAAAARRIGGAKWVVKAQVHAGGRGKGGGVKLVDSPEAAGKAAAAMLGTRLKTHQTGPEGLPVHQVFVEEGSKIARELYLSLVLNRDKGHIAFIASAAGGMDIEEVAAHTPEKIIRVNVHPAAGLQPSQCRVLAFGLGLEGKQIEQFASIAQALYRLYLEKDASLVEVNPLIVTGDGMLVALDAKINIEDNALFRQKELAKWRDNSQEDEMERAARRARAQLRLARRRHRLHGQRRRPRDGDDGPDQAARRRARQLPRRRRRRNARARHRGVQPDSLEQERARDPGEHLRRHRPLRHDRRGHHPRRAKTSACACRSWCASKARTRSRAASSSRRAGWRSSPPPT